MRRKENVYSQLVATINRLDNEQDYIKFRRRIAILENRNKAYLNRNEILMLHNLRRFVKKRR